MTSGAAPLLTDLLKAVSRSFYLTLRVLPAQVRPQLGLAYLLARATDTIADTQVVPVVQRLAALRELRERILGRHTQTLDFTQLALSQDSERTAPRPDGTTPQVEHGKTGNLDASHGTNAERILLERIEEALAVLNQFTAEDQQRIRDVLAVIVGGQELDLQRFGAASAASIAALRTAAELDDYTYRVAGCVGEFWTRMCRAHVFPSANLDDAALLRDGVRFGKGLQLVNILRDLPRDLRHGRCYLPLGQLTRISLVPEDLLQPRMAERLRPLYNEWLDAAEAHLAAGWSYTNALPRSAVRVRLACAWPVLIGIRTVARLRGENPLDAERRVKVSRAEVKRIMSRTVLHYPFARSWARLFERARL
jgi:farnesyl-diphosphate farnesyltransferase